MGEGQPVVVVVQVQDLVLVKDLVLVQDFVVQVQDLVLDDVALYVALCVVLYGDDMGSTCDNAENH